MSTKNSIYALGCILSLTVSTVTAATITATSSHVTAAVGDTITINLHGDFSSLNTLGGGFDVFFDSSHLDFIAFGFSDAANFADDPSLRRDPNILDGELNGIAFGNFDGLGGIFELAIIQFQVLSGGSSQISLAVNEDGPPSNPGGFFDFQGFPMNVDFVGTQITTVPLPAAIWLLGSAGSMLLGLSRRRNRNPCSSNNDNKLESTR